MNSKIKKFLLVYTMFWFIFALVSGAQDFGEGFKGILINSPNAIPWVILLLIVYLTYKKPVLSGILIFLVGIFTVFFFKTYEDFVVFLIVSLPLLFSGAVLFSNQKVKD